MLKNDPNSQPSGITATSMRFDRIWNKHSSQDDVFEEAQHLVDSAFHGYNATIFAYGPSGSGKTHTMIGTKQEPGIVPRSLNRIFELADKQQDSMFMIALTVLELYNDQFFDLLDNTKATGWLGCKQRSARSLMTQTGTTILSPSRKIEVVRNGRQSQLKGDYMRIQIDDPSAAMSIIENGLNRRSTSGTMVTGLDTFSSSSPLQPYHTIPYHTIPSSPLLPCTVLPSPPLPPPLLSSPLLLSLISA
eukprot:746766-Hanusia_phi.AAC.1